MYKKLFSIILVAAILLVALVPAAFAATRDQEPNEPGMVGNGHGQDDRSHPLEEKRRALMQQAVIDKIKANISGDSVDPGEFEPLAFEGSDPVWTVLGEFSDFEHNSILEPDRDYDNTTLWVEDFDPGYYLCILFDIDPAENATCEDRYGATASMSEFYLEQSSGRYTVEGDVTGWVKVPGNAYDYDDGAPTGPSCGPCVWSFIQDSVEGWYDQQIAAGLTPDDINDYLSKYDVWDRYDYDEDGDYDEPDGYIDHFQSVHAGEGNEAGGGALGDHAIWSHSWYAFPCPLEGDKTGPEFNPLCGIQIRSSDGENTSDYWIGKYVINPENGGVGVFAHEYGHDLGLPDLYDYTGENSTGFWTLMSSGSWLSAEGSGDIGSKPSHIGAWEKLQLGWLKHEVVESADAAGDTFKLGPMEYNSTELQALIVTLPDKEIHVIVGEAYEGDYLYYSGSGDRLDNFMYKAFTLGSSAEFSAMVSYDIETDWDYAYLVASVDDGETWAPIETNLSSTTDPNLQNYGYGITGSSGGWLELTADLSAYEGEVLLGFRYWTDGNTVGHGFMADNLVIDGSEIDGAETDTGWTYDGFMRTAAEYDDSFFNAYVAEFRQYTLYDEVLKNPYNFFWTGSYPYYNWVTHYPYQDGLLINYWDTSFPNNNVGSHCAAGRCGGLLLTVDAHPEVLYQKGGVPGSAGGVPWRNRVQTYDATFGLEDTDQITLYWRDSKLSEHFVRGEIGGLPANPTFCDYNSYYDPANPMGSVIVPGTGTQIQVNGVSDYTEDGAYMVVSVDKCEPEGEE